MTLPAMKGQVGLLMPNPETLRKRALKLSVRPEGTEA
jgi:hypothetical protein